MKKENVIGKLILTIPYIGYIGYFVRTPIGFILLIIIPASLIIIMEIRNIIKELKKTKQGGKAVEGWELRISYHSPLSPVPYSLTNQKGVDSKSQLENAGNQNHSKTNKPFCFCYS